MSRFKGIHWQSPTIMLLSLLGGFSLILGHHSFYASLDRKAVPTESYSIAGRNLSQQQLNISVGTAFALLVKICLAVAVSTAYVQLFWRSTRTAEPPTLVELDLAHEGLDNLFSFFNPRFWWRYPSLVVLGLIFWCIPLATIFPPATLSVANASRNITSMLKVPQYDFTTLDFVTPMEFGYDVGRPNTMSLWVWSGPSQPLQNIAIAGMALGQILPITAPAPNASWTLNFWGPLLQCNDVIGIERDQIWTNIWNSYNHGPGSYAFLSWAPWPALLLEQLDKSSGQSPNASNRDLPFQYSNNYSSSPWQFSTGGPASLFVAVLPEAQRLAIKNTKNTSASTSIDVEYDWPTGHDNCRIPTLQNLTDTVILECDEGNIPFTPSSMHNDSTLLRCDLLNSSYSVNMNYLNGIQDIQVSTNRTGISPLVNGSDVFIAGPTVEEPSCFAFLVYDSYRYSEENLPPCVFDVSAMRLLSYQGIMTAFNQLILGDIRIYTTDKASHKAIDVRTSTTILKTVLAQTDELAFFRNMSTISYPTQAYLQPMISNLKEYNAYSGLLNSNLPRTRADLKSTLEQLFQNFTVSLLSEPYFQPNYSSRFAPNETTNVSVLTYQNVYSYDRTTLWIAYGVPLFFATLVIVAGMFAILQSGASYSGNFSTIVRVSRRAKLSVGVADQDGSGCDPLPKYLEKARLDLGVSTATANTYELVETGTEEQEMDLVPKDPKMRSDTGMTI